MWATKHISFFFQCGKSSILLFSNHWKRFVSFIICITTVIINMFSVAALLCWSQKHLGLRERESENEKLPPLLTWIDWIWMVTATGFNKVHSIHFLGAILYLTKKFRKLITQSVFNVVSKISTHFQKYFKKIQSDQILFNPKMKVFRRKSSNSERKHNESVIKDVHAI